MKRNIILGSIAVLIFIVLLVVSINSQPKKTAPSVKPELTPTPTTAISDQAQSVLFLTPDPVILDSNGTGTIDVNIKTGSNQVTAVQLQMKYDPAAITNISVKAADFFQKPIELLKRINRDEGQITLMLGISPTQQPATGNGTVAKITFSKTPQTTLKETSFIFSTTETSESIVAATGIDLSVLKSATGTKIKLQ